MRPAIAIVVLGLSVEARANPAGLVPGGKDPALGAANYANESVNVFAGVDYEYEQDSAEIWREHVGDPAMDPNAPLATHRDLKFQQFRHTITPHLEVGFFKDSWVYGALPIVITQARELRLDSGVDRTGSSTVVDGLLPSTGFDATDPGTPPPEDLMFRGINRKGLSEVRFGIGFAPMNQLRDDTKPTWKMGAEMHVAIGTVMKFDPMAPGANTGVSTGVHELKLWTSFDRRLGWAEPWVNLWWQTPIATTQDSLFQDPGFGSTNTGKGQQAGVEFGFEAYAIDNADDHNRISLDLGTRAVAHFEGREYSEMWEVFAYAGDSRTPTNPLILDADPTKDGVQALSYPGISNIENYLKTAARVALRGEIGPHVRFAVLGDFVWKTDHAITFADAGVDLPTCGTTSSTKCETMDNDVVNPGTQEVNPLHVQKIDLVGHRYRSQANFGFILGVQGQVLF